MPVGDETKGERRARGGVGFQRWKRFPIVALPHPSRHYWTDEYIASFKELMSSLIADYKAE